jgi:hypothetical protein
LIGLLTHNKKTNDNEKTHITRRLKKKQVDLISDAQILCINKSIVALETHKTTKQHLEKISNRVNDTLKKKTITKVDEASNSCVAL